VRLLFEPGDESSCGVWLVENGRVDAQGETARPREGRLVVRVRECGVQSDLVAEIAAEICMTQAMCLFSAASGSKRPLEEALDIHQ
jgi:hypothetical protein